MAVTRPALAHFLDRRLSRFTEEQRPAILTLDRPVALLAAAGSGKTSVLVERYLHCLAHGMDPRNILAITFTNEAASEMRHRIVATLAQGDGDFEKLISQVEGSPYLGTIHSFCYRILEQYGSLLELPPIQTIATELEYCALFDLRFTEWMKAMGDAELETLLGHFSITELRAFARSFVDSRGAFGAIIPVQTPEWFNSLLPRFGELFQQVTEAMRAEGKYRFDELEHFALRLLTEKSEVTDRIRSQFQAVCVDEFQDTSLVQWQIVLAILGPHSRRLFVVGDPKQSIYSFRKADVKVFLESVNQVKAWGGLELELTTNFRSEPKLLAELNRFAAKLFAESEIPFTPMRPGLLADSGVPLHVYRSEGVRTEWSVFEMAEVTKQVQSLLALGTLPSQICLLFRNAERVSAYAEALRSQGVAASAKRRSTLFSHYAVQEILFFLRAIADPKKDYWLTGFLCSSYGGMEYADLALWMNDRARPLYENLVGNCERLQWFFDLVASEEKNVAQLLLRLVAETRQFPEENEALFHLLSHLWDEERTLEVTIQRLEAWENASLAFTPSEPEEVQAVKLLTVHGAKGLEYDHIFLVDLLRPLPRRYPSLQWGENGQMTIRYRDAGEFIESEAYSLAAEKKQLAEEEEGKRVLYVALTRAKKSLSIFLPKDLKGAPKQSWGIWLSEHTN